MTLHYSFNTLRTCYAHVQAAFPALAEARSRNNSAGYAGTCFTLAGLSESASDEQLRVFFEDPFKPIEWPSATLEKLIVLGLMLEFGNLGQSQMIIPSTVTNADLHLSRIYRSGYTGVGQSAIDYVVPLEKWPTDALQLQIISDLRKHNAICWVCLRLLIERAAEREKKEIPDEPGSML